MKKLLNVLGVLAFLAIPQIASADKPSWAGTQISPTQEQVQEHKEAMTSKNDDKPYLNKMEEKEQKLIKKQEKEKKTKKDKKSKKNKKQ